LFSVGAWWFYLYCCCYSTDETYSQKFRKGTLSEKTVIFENEVVARSIVAGLLCVFDVCFILFFYCGFIVYFYGVFLLLRSSSNVIFSLYLVIFVCFKTVNPPTDLHSILNFCFNWPKTESTILVGKIGSKHDYACN